MMVLWIWAEDQPLKRFGGVLAEDLPLFDDAFERVLWGYVPESIEYRIQRTD